jgi:beta-glucosidase
MTGAKLMKAGLAAAIMSAVTIPADAVKPPRSAAATAQRPWMNAALAPARRVALLLPRMSQDEKQSLVVGYFATSFPAMKFSAPAGSREGSAGFVPGIPRLGIPPQWQTDAGIGVATQGAAQRKRERTALPSGLATAATWNRALAYRGGAMIGAEARASGFNVMLAGGANLVREPRNGRNFEYGGEDPLLAGEMVSAQIAGIQSNHIISTLKHFAINDQETDRNQGNAIIDPKAARLSDLLAFEIALEKGDPGSVMCAYNRVNGPFACENPWLLTDVLRRDWGFHGYVMSDWGATHSTEAAISAGLDQQSGFPFDRKPYFGADLTKALAEGRVAKAQLDRMVSRILFAMFKHGLFDRPITAAPDDLPDAMLAKDAAISRADAAEAITLLKNDGGILPLAAQAKRIVVIGGHADKGVIAGGGSSLVYPKGGNAVPGVKPITWPGPVMYYPSSPLAALRERLPGARIDYVDGSDPAQAAELARSADIAIVFGTQWAGESFDVPLALDAGGDALIDAVAAANPRTVVVLETGGAVLTPWAGKVPAIVEAWFPGTAGGEAIADVLTGRVNPSGHLPVSFPASLDQLPHPQAPGKSEFHYDEGAQVGYKWYDSRTLTPAFPFGHGLSYTRFHFSGLTARVAGGTIKVQFSVRNMGRVAGKAVAQLYAAAPGWEAPRRLVGFDKVELAPGRAGQVTLGIDPRLLADFDTASRCWRLAPGKIRLELGDSSADLTQRATLVLVSATIGKSKSLCRSGKAG